MENKVATDNKKLYEQREQPKALTPLPSGEYVWLETCTSLAPLESLETLLSRLNNETENYVIGEWRDSKKQTIGYGVYNAQKAEELARLSQEEEWSQYVFGPTYDLDFIKKRLGLIENKKLFRDRQEPQILKPINKGEYASLQQCKDLALLESLEAILEEESSQRKKECVIAFWYTPPFYKILGYGIYSKHEAENLKERSEENLWGSPKFGDAYDLGWIRERIDFVKNPNNYQ